MVGCGVVWCGVVSSAAKWSRVVCTGVMWSEVVGCGVSWSGVHWCGVAWGSVVWCCTKWRAVVWCGVVLLVTLMTFYPRRNLSGRIRVGSVSSTRKQTALLSQYLWAKLVLGYTSNFHTARSFKWDASRRNVLKCGVYWRCDTFLSLQRICFFYEAIFLHGLNGHLW